MGYSISSRKMSPIRSVVCGGSVRRSMRSGLGCSCTSNSSPANHATMGRLASEAAASGQLLSTLPVATSTTMRLASSL